MTKKDDMLSVACLISYLCQEAEQYQEDSLKQLLGIALLEVEQILKKDETETDSRILLSSSWKNSNFH